MSKYSRINGNYKISVNSNGNIILNTGDQLGSTEIICDTLSVNNTFLLSNNAINGIVTDPLNPFNLFTNTTQDITISGDTISDELDGITFLGISPTQEAVGREVVTAEWMAGRSCAATPQKSVMINTVDATEVIDTGFDWGIYRAALYSLHVTNFMDAYELAFATQTSKVMVSNNAPLHVSVAMEDSVSDIITVDSTQGLYPGMTVEVVGCSLIH